MRGRRGIGLVCAVALVGAACSSGSAAGSGSGGSASSTTRGSVERLAGPAADLGTELTGGSGPFIGSAATFDAGKVGYVEHEYAASGTATSYRNTGDFTEDGRWSFAPDGSAEYRTRVIVRRPARGRDFSGTVVVEWLNVSGGVDADPDWASLHEELIRAGDAWVGVSAQLIGVMGGPVLVGVPGVGEDIVGKGLRAIDPARYGTLQHPGDGFSFDIFTQVARAMREGGKVLGGATPTRVIAAGESQSAIALVTYVNGVQPLTHAFDGFFVHSRASVALPLVGPGEYADLAGSFGGGTTIFRTDGDAPVMDLQAESDVVGVLDSIGARQSDTDRFRLWEVAGTAHADRHLVGSIADTLDCGLPINDGPLHVVAKAAFHGLERWVRTGEPPAHRARLETTVVAPAAIRRDADGIAQGGVRTPPVDVPVAVLSGVPGPNPAVICILLGSTQPLPADQLAAKYPSRAAYLQQYRRAVRHAIARGVVLAADRAAIMAYAHPDSVGG